MYLIYKWINNARIINGKENQCMCCWLTRECWTLFQKSKSKDPHVFLFTTCQPYSVAVESGNIAEDEVQHSSWKKVCTDAHAWLFLASTLSAYTDKYLSMKMQKPHQLNYYTKVIY